jgi:hypothetical protein
VLLILNWEEMEKENQRLKDVKAVEVKKYNALSATEKSKKKRKIKGLQSSMHLCETTFEGLGGW